MSLIRVSSLAKSRCITRGPYNRTRVFPTVIKRADIPEEYLKRGVKKRLDEKGNYKGEIEELPEIHSTWDLTFHKYQTEDFRPWSWQLKLLCLVLFWVLLLGMRYLYIVLHGQYRIRESELPELDVLEDYGLQHIDDQRILRGIKLPQQNTADTNSASDE